MKAAIITEAIITDYCPNCQRLMDSQHQENCEPFRRFADTLPYFVPANAGIPSEPANAGKRLAKLLNALDSHVTEYIGQGALIEEIREFRNRMLAQLRSEGWQITNTETRGWYVIPGRTKV